MTFARYNAVERKAVADIRDVWINAYRRNLGRTTYEAVSSEFSRGQERGQFINIRATVGHPKSLQSARTPTYNPTRLSGVNVYTEAERLFAEGDRLQSRAPFAEKRVVKR